MFIAAALHIRISEFICTKFQYKFCNIYNNNIKEEVEVEADRLGKEK